MEMVAIAVAQGSFKLIMATVACLFARGFLMWLDRSTTIDFFKNLREASPDARMHYFSYRYVGTCILFGLVIS